MSAAIKHLNGKVKPHNAKYVTRHDPELGYAVWSPEGERVTDWTIREGAAITRMKQLQVIADKKARKQVRACMCCRKSFESEGIHNRLCPPCRQHGRDIDNPSSIGRISGIRRSA